ncbi:PREDICTED: protein shisa-6 homolog isoform X3 [Cyprinodon variegatus]|uniref:protein shisa-6 homolog isoform X3 n=1 Tax=Cyprinodon variegatus TaxID=28743 RepID=UPI0007429073|nr:PREDICTED: protein shisa-6 homolog isoform X3 [Cyprinodon variegatus]
MMGIKHLLLLLIYLDPLNVLCAAANANKRSKPPPRRNPKVKEVNASTTALPAAIPRKITQVQAPSVGQHDTCMGYYDVSGQYDKEFACNNTDHRFCCGSCFLRFCCADRGKRLEQKTCTNYNTPDWIKTQPPSPAPTGDTYDPALDQTNTTVYITCGVIALIIAIGISAKVAYDKATKPPQEMNVHRALADILRQQGPVSASQFEHEDIAAINGSPKDETPIRTSKNHYTPVHAKTSNHGHYGKENLRTGGQDMHNFISSGFVTLGRGHLKAQQSIDESGQMSWQGDMDIPMSYGNHHHDYQHSHLDLTALTPKLAHRHMGYDRPQRMNNILTSATEPYDLSLSRSFQNLSHHQPSYEMPHKPDLSDKDMDDYYPRKHLHPDFGGRGPTHMVKLNAEPHQHQQHQQRQRPRRVQRAMSQDHVLSPPRTPRRGDYGLSSYSGMAATAYGSSRNLSNEQLLSADRLHSQDPLLSPAMRRDKFREKAMARAMSHADMLMPTTPVMDRHKMTKMHSQPSASTDSYNTLMVNHHSGTSTSKRQAFASRRTHTVDHLQYIPGHHHTYRTASKNEHELCV